MKEKTTWLDYIRKFDKNITEEVAEYILWEETAFPCADIKTTKIQIKEFFKNKGKEK